MKVMASVKKICRKCKIVRRKRVVRVICTDPRHKQPKTYWVQVEGTVTDAALQRLRSGVTLNDGPARAVLARHIDAPAGLWPRQPPVRPAWSSCPRSTTPIAPPPGAAAGWSL